MKGEKVFFFSKRQAGCRVEMINFEKFFSIQESVNEYSKKSQEESSRTNVTTVYNNENTEYKN